MGAVVQAGASESHPVRFWFLLFLLTSVAYAERFRLRHTSAAEILPILSKMHSQLRFLKCPGGFKVQASARDLQALRQEVKMLDVPWVEEWVAIEHGDRVEIMALVDSLVPGASLELSGDYHLTVGGGRPAVQQALELIQQLDRPREKLTVECRVVLDTPEVRPFLGSRWFYGLSDEQPVVKHWELERSTQPLWIPMMATAEAADFEGAAPWVLSCHRIQTLSGDDLDFSVKSTGSPQGIRWQVTTNAKQDGYVVMKFLPEVNDGTSARKFTSDLRVKPGETAVLAGLGQAEDLGLAGEGPVFLMITVRPGW